MSFLNTYYVLPRMKAEECVRGQSERMRRGEQAQQDSPMDFCRDLCGGLSGCICARTDFVYTRRCVTVQKRDARLLVKHPYFTN